EFLPRPRFFSRRGDVPGAAAPARASVSLLGSPAVRKSLAPSGQPRRAAGRSLSIDRSAGADPDRHAGGADAESHRPRGAQTILSLPGRRPGSGARVAARASGSMGLSKRASGGG